MDYIAAGESKCAGLILAFAGGLVVTTCVDLNNEINKSPHCAIKYGLAASRRARCLQVQQSKGTKECRALVLSGKCTSSTLQTLRTHTQTQKNNLKMQERTKFVHMHLIRAHAKSCRDILT